jgi:crotonobetainyl-CoA:carnitine CoA-transferase CaiB-like acyl-CoA transferase
MPPFINGESAPFMTWNRNKRSVIMDFKKQADRMAFLDLVDRADVVVENYRPGVMERLGIGWDVLHARNPKLVLASISGFGQTGPYASRGGFDLITQAMSGLMSTNGPADGPPHRLPIAISDVTAGMFLAFGVMTALEARHRTGEGQRVETSLFEAATSLAVYESAHYFATGTRPERIGQAHRGSAPYQCFQTADGYITVGASRPKFFEGFCGLTGLSSLLEDERFASNASRVKNNDALVALLQARVIEKPSAFWLSELEKIGVPAGPVLYYDEVFTDPQILARDMVVETTHLKESTITNNGLDHSRNIKVIERFKLSADRKQLLSTQEFEDPEVLDNRGARFISWDRGVEGDHVHAYDCDPSFAENYAN